MLAWPWFICVYSLVDWKFTWIWCEMLRYAALISIDNIVCHSLEFFWGWIIITIFIRPVVVKRLAFVVLGGKLPNSTLPTVDCFPSRAYTYRIPRFALLSDAVCGWTVGKDWETLTKRKCAKVLTAFSSRVWQVFELGPYYPPTGIWWNGWLRTPWRRWIQKLYFAVFPFGYLCDFRSDWNSMPNGKMSRSLQCDIESWQE